MEHKTPPLELDSHKLAWHPDRVNAWLKGEKVAPITIDCAISTACNYKCVYCYGQLQTNKKVTLSKDVVFSFLDNAGEIGVKGISFVSDGESTCSPHLYDAILRGKENGIDMALGTNGALLKPERLPEVLPALTYLRFNITGGEPKRYAEIHGCKEEDFEKVKEKIRGCVEIKRKGNLETTIGMQMVLMPEFEDQILPLARLGKELGVDYLVIKHCSDDEQGSLGVDYEGYEKLVDKLKEAEALSTPEYFVKAKWSKILSGGKRRYSACYGAPLFLQISGTGLVAPCGGFFNEQYEKYHIGNLNEKSFKEIWNSERYWQVMEHIASDKFDARTDCTCLCLQHKVNEYLWDLKQNGIKEVRMPKEAPPQHINFI